MKTELELRMLFWEEADTYLREGEYVDMKPYMTEDKFVEVVKQLQLPIVLVTPDYKEEHLQRILEQIDLNEHENAKIIICSNNNTELKNCPTLTKEKIGYIGGHSGINKTVFPKEVLLVEEPFLTDRHIEILELLEKSVNFSNASCIEPKVRILYKKN